MNIPLSEQLHMPQREYSQCSNSQNIKQFFWRKDVGFDWLFLAEEFYKFALCKDEVCKCFKLYF